MSTAPTCPRSTATCAPRASPPPMSASSPTSSPAPAWITARWPRPVRSRSRKRSRTRFDALKLEHDIGPLKIKISGCINACGHHHVGHIGILGLDRAGVENYQITLGGDGTETATIGERTGPGFAHDEIVPAIERLIAAYLDHRDNPEETFLADLSPPRNGALQDRALPPSKGSPRCRLKSPLAPVAERVRDLNARYRHHSAISVLEHALGDAQVGRIAMVSSFGAESVALLHMVSVLDRSVPILFLDTRDAVPRNAGLSARGGRAPGAHRYPHPHPRPDRNLSARPRG